MEGIGAFNSKEFNKICSYYVICRTIRVSREIRSRWVRGFLESKKDEQFSPLPINSKRILIQKLEILDIVRQGYVPKTKWNKLITEWENDKWAMLTVGNTPNFEGNIEQLCQELNDVNSYGFYVYYLDWTKTQVKDKTEMSPFAKAWLDINEGQAVLTQKKKEP